MRVVMDSVHFYVNYRIYASKIYDNHSEKKHRQMQETLYINSFEWKNHKKTLFQAKIVKHESRKMSEMFKNKCSGKH